MLEKSVFYVGERSPFLLERRAVVLERRAVLLERRAVLLERRAAFFRKELTGASDSRVDEKTAADYALEGGATLHLVLALRGGKIQ